MANGSRGVVVLASLCAVAGMLGGCGGLRSEQVMLLRTEDFIGDREASRVLAQSPVPTEHAAPREPVPEGALGEMVEEVADVGLAVGAPAIRSDAVAVERPILIDAKIGEINGRPVRVQEILNDFGLERRLIAEARERDVTRSQWLEIVRHQIALQLESLLQNELLRAEALASLKPEQRMGLRYMVQEMSENLRREHGGSRAAAERRLREVYENKSLHQVEREREAAILVIYQIEEKIKRRVRVSWKDVRLYYERNADLYNPPSEARVRMIRVPADNTEGVEKVRAALQQEDADFAAIAAWPENTYNARTSGLVPQPYTFKGELANAEIDLVEPLASALRGLEAGRHTIEPVEFRRDRGGSDMTWIFLESIRDRRRPLSDRDVQREIADMLTRMQQDAEIQRHIDRLKERASFTDVVDMTQRLVEIAAERYWPRE
jgi:hypothetical protein